MKTLRWASLALLVAGCGPNRVVQMGFVLPSLLERFGRRMTVADFEGPMGTEISDRIRSQVESSGVFEVVPIDRAEMAVSGSLIESRILPEEAVQRTVLVTRNRAKERMESSSVQSSVPT